MHEVVAGLIADRLAATCATIDLEAGYSGRDFAEVEAIQLRRRDLYRLLPLTEEAAERAREVQLRMAKRGHHRAAGVFDLLSAAAAELNGAVILHYDHDFEHIAAVTGQPQVWVVPPGSID
ncbi:PIN domain-containing protein [Microlunatus elymi]|uniref:PIN domain-containing protein n=1 Tax=Microlunatus elymi TaxID=2596828 RepID=UPI00224A9851|nr:PIN domain-containing protein [Microlunatus elymi]